MRFLEYAVVPALLTAVIALAGCGGSETVSDDADAAEAGASTAPSAAPSATPSAAPSPTPSTAPGPGPTLEPGSYPTYPHDDYSYVLRLRCYCAFVDQPIAVTVADGKVAEAVWAEKSPEHAAGDPVGKYGARTLDQIIDDANDPEMFSVLVDWEPGAEHPTKVSLDRDEMMVDEETTYLISDVEPAQ